MLRHQVLPSSGDLIDGKYRVLGQLGAGGMGVVFEAINTATEKHVALKFLSPELSFAPEAAERFKREARATGRIHHPNVVAVHDCGDHEGRLYLVLELLRGDVLRVWMAKHRVDLRAACQVLFPVMRGIAAAHSAGVLHRDLKPDNIFLADSPDGLDPVPKVLDFGLAKLSATADKATQLSAVGTAMGTYQFMAPEQLRSQGEPDARVDVYALGAILFQMLAGRPPYSADNPVDLALQIVASEAAPISAFAPVPSGADQVIGRALARDRNYRYPSVEEFAVALEPFAGGLGFRGTARRAHVAPAAEVPAFSVTEQFNVRPLSTPFQPRTGATVKARRSIWPIALAAVLALGGLTVAGGFMFNLGLSRSAGSPLGSLPAAVPAVPVLNADDRGRPAAPIAPPVRRPQNVMPQADSDVVTFEEPAAASADWAGTQETWPSPLPDSRPGSSRDSHSKVRSSVGNSADDETAHDPRRVSRRKTRRREMEVSASANEEDQPEPSRQAPTIAPTSPDLSQSETPRPAPARAVGRAGAVFGPTDF